MVLIQFISRKRSNKSPQHTYLCSQRKSSDSWRISHWWWWAYIGQWSVRVNIGHKISRNSVLEQIKKKIPMRWLHKNKYNEWRHRTLIENSHQVLLSVTIVHWRSCEVKELWSSTAKWLNSRPNFRQRGYFFVTIELNRLYFWKSFTEIVKMDTCIGHVIGYGL